jgi:LmbE family N-acetylglucosaminyl deacetylase
MLSLEILRPDQITKVLCLGAHSDDIEIGLGGTILTWLARGAKLDVTWCVLSGETHRAAEARSSAGAFLESAFRSNVNLASFRDSYFPNESSAVKEWLESLRSQIEKPDIVFCHRSDDAHQDHRVVSQLTWNLFRDHLILEYEIPKWDGDLGQPNAYVALDATALERKLDLLQAHFSTQAGKDWFDRETFRGLARIRGMECRSPSLYAEAFHIRKLLLK